VCGANGVTFINECLALCGGTAVAHAGPCGRAGAAAAASVSAAGAANLGEHPIGQFLAGGPSEARAAASGAGAPVVTATAAPPAAASAADISRFAAEGFALVGPARLGEFKVRGRRPGAPAWGLRLPCPVCPGAGAPTYNAGAAGACSSSRRVRKGGGEAPNVAGPTLAPDLRPAQLPATPPPPPSPPPKVTKPEKRPGAAVSTAARGAAAEPGAVFTVRVLPEEGLVYVSTKPIVPAAAAGATSGSVPSVAPVSAAPDAPAAVAAAGAGTGEASATQIVRSRMRAAARKLRAAGWDEVTTLLEYPFKAIGWLNVGFQSGAGSCSGSVFGSSAVVTAAVSGVLGGRALEQPGAGGPPLSPPPHPRPQPRGCTHCVGPLTGCPRDTPPQNDARQHCVYDRYSGTTIKRARFTPHNFYNARGLLNTPFGAFDAYSFDFLSGWSENNDIETAWVSDMAVILLKKEVGSQTGMLGFAYDDKGYSGTITAAGYPGESPRVQVRGARAGGGMGGGAAARGGALGREGAMRGRRLGRHPAQPPPPSTLSLCLVPPPSLTFATPPPLLQQQPPRACSTA
jgi:V8-like Glu-specific endopeptidase